MYKDELLSNLIMSWYIFKVLLGIFSVCVPYIHFILAALIEGVFEMCIGSSHMDSSYLYRIEMDHFMILVKYVIYKINRTEEPSEFSETFLFLHAKQYRQTH